MRFLYMYGPILTTFPVMLFVPIQWCAVWVAFLMLYFTYQFVRISWITRIRHRWRRENLANINRTPEYFDMLYSYFWDWNGDIEHWVR